MPLPYEKPATLLQWLDNLGHYVLRFGRRVRRFLGQVLRLLLWFVCQVFRLVRQSFLLLCVCVRRAFARYGADRRQFGRPRLYLLDPSYQNNFGHYRTIARHLAKDCARRGWDFIHLTGSRDRNPAQRIPLFPFSALLPIRLAEPFWTRKQRRWAFCKTAFVVRYFFRMLRIVAALDRLILPGHAARFVMYTGDFPYFMPLLDSPFLGPRQQLTLCQFYLPLHFGEPSEKRRFLAHARLLGRRFRSAAPRATNVLHLCSDSPRLRDLLSPALGSNISLLYPPLLAALRLEDLPSPESLAQRPHPFGYCGYLSEKHGWPVIRQLLQSHAGKNTRWLVQFIPTQQTAAEVAPALDAITAAGAISRTGYSSDEQYAANLASCACLLLPYDADDYAYLSSAKVIDALRHGCFPIVPADTWPAEIVRRAGYGLIVQKGQWLDAPAAVAKLDLPSLWSERRSTVLALIQQFTAAHFLTALEQISPTATLPKN